MNKFVLNVYAEDGVTVKKELIASEFDLTFGTIRKLMKLLKIDKAKDTVQLLAAINDAWDDITSLLERIFTEATEEDWDNVKVKELLPLVVKIAKYALAQAVSIPTEKN